MFVLSSFSRYLNAMHGVPDWERCVVISNEQFSNPAVQMRIMQGRLPFIIEIVSRYWVYNYNSEKEIDIWVTDNIYDVIAMWLYILKIQYKSMLLEYNLTKLIDKIFKSAE